MNFGERLYELRTKQNMSQEQLAELLDVSRQSVSKWENDKGFPEMSRILFMSDYFQISLDYLMRGMDEPSKEERKKETFKPQTIRYAWNSFLSNLSENQIKLFYVMLVMVCFFLILFGFYGVGYVIGKAAYYMQH